MGTRYFLVVRGSVESWCKQDNKILPIVSEIGDLIEQPEVAPLIKTIKVDGVGILPTYIFVCEIDGLERILVNADG